MQLLRGLESLTQESWATTDSLLQLDKKLLFGTWHKRRCSLPATFADKCPSIPIHEKESIALLQNVGADEVLLL